MSAAADAPLLLALLVLGGTAGLATQLQTNFIGDSGQNTLTVSQTVDSAASLERLDEAAAVVEAELFEIDGVELEFTPDAVEAVADQALLRGTGARGLRAILEEVLQQVMFDVPSRDDVARVWITREVVLENVNPTIVPREAPAKRTPRETSA